MGTAIKGALHTDFKRNISNLPEDECSYYLLKGDTMPEPKRKLLLNTFSKLKQQVIWKWESESMPDLPKNVLLKKWLPQQGHTNFINVVCTNQMNFMHAPVLKCMFSMRVDLLAHKDIKLFVTHCGGGSTEEAIFHGVMF